MATTSTKCPPTARSIAVPPRGRTQMFCATGAARSARPRLRFISNICRFAQKISESNVDGSTEWRRFHIGRRMFKYALTIVTAAARRRQQGNISHVHGLRAHDVVEPVQPGTAAGAQAGELAATLRVLPAL